MPERFRAQHSIHEVNFFAAPRHRADSTLELFAQRKDGTEFPAEIHINHHTVAGERVAIASVRDISKRKQAEEKLQASERKNRALFNQYHDAVFILDLQGNHLDVNQRAADMLGYTHEEMIGLSPQQISADPEQSFNILERLIKGEHFPVYERLFRRKNGDRLPVEINLELIRDANGDPMHIQSVVRDISERKKAEEALAVTRQLSQATTDGLNAHLCVLDETGTILSVNHAWRKFANANPPVPENCCVGSNYLAVCDGATGANSEEAAPFAAGLRRVLSGESNGFDLEYPCHAPKGEQRWFTAHVSRFMVGGQARVVITHENITERKQAEQNTQASEFRYRSLVENMHEVVMETDAEGLFCYLSPNYEALSGYSISEELGTPAFTHVHPEDQALLRQRLEQVTRNGNGSLSYRVQTKSGKWIWVETSARAAQAEDGSLHLVAVVRDISERVEAETQILQLKRLYATLSQVNQMIVRVKEQAELFQSICDMVVRFGEFSLAWVGLLNEATGDITPVAANGLDVNNWPLPIINIYQEAYKDSLGTQAIRTGQVMVSENVQVDPRLQALHSSLAERPYRASAAVPFKRGGRIIGILGFVSPQAGFFKAEEELALLAEMGLDISFALDMMENERIKQQWADAFEHSAHGMVIGDVKTNLIRACNPAFARDQGATIEELIGTPLIDMYLPEDHARIKQMIAQSDREGSVQFEGVKLRKDGSTYPFQLDLVSVQDGNGNLLYRVASQQDITERKQKEESLRAEQIRFSSVAATIPEAICTFHLYPDGTLNIPYASKAFENIYGLTLDDVSQNISAIIDRVSPDDAQRLMKAVQESAQSMLPWREEYQYQHPTKGVIWLEGHSTPVQEADGSTVWYGVTSDITERKAIEEERAEVHSRLSKITTHIPGFVFQFLLTPDGKFSVPYASTGIYDLYEVTPEQVREDATAIFNSVHPEDAERVRGKIMESAEKMISWHEENRIILPSGREKWVEGHSTPQREKDGSIAWYGFTQDITERKQAEQIILESESKYRLLAENITDVIWILDIQNSAFRYVSPSVKQMRGYTVEEVMCQSLTDALMPPSLEYLAQALPVRIDLLGKGVLEAYTDELEQPCKDGSTVWTETTTRFIQNPETGHLEVYGVSRDITKRKRAEDALKRNERILRLFVEHSPASIAMFDRDMHYIVHSRRYLVDYGLPQHDLTGLSHYEIFPEIPERWKEIHRRCQAGNIERAEEDPFPRIDGHTDYVHWEIHPWYDDNGAIGGIILFSEVITERVLAREELAGKHHELLETASQLEASHNMLGLIIESAPVRIFWKDNESRYLGCNRLFAQDAGYASPEELIGKMDDELIWKDKANLFRQQEREIITSGVPILNKEEIQATTTGRTMWVNVSMVTLKEPNGEIIGTLGIYEDITERKQAEKELFEAREIFQKTFTSSPFAIALSRLSDRIIVDVNSAMENLLGWSREELVNKPAIEFNYWADRDERERALEIVRRDGSLRDFEFKFKTKSGAIGQALNYTDMFEQHGDTYLLSTFVDITESRKAEEALKESEERFSTAFFTSPVSQSIITQEASEVLAVNDACCKLFGYSRDELIGAKTNDLNLWANPAERISAAEELIKTGHLLPREVAIRMKSGEIRITITEIEPITWQGIPCFISTIFDITDRKQAEEALRNSHVIYRQAIEVAGAVPYYQSYYDERRKVKYDFIGEGIRQITGYDPGEFTAKLWDELTEEIVMVGDLAGYSLEEAIQFVRAGSHPIWKCEHRIRDRLGVTHWVFEAAVELRDENGVSYGSIGMYQDITERKQAEETLKQRLAELELLYQSGLAISGELEPGQVANKLIEALEGKMDWHHVAIRKYDSESDLLELLAFKQLSVDSETQRQGLEKRFNEAVSNSSQGMSGWVVQHGQTVRSGNVQADERYAETYPGIGSGLYAPMMLGGHVVGVISVESKDLNAFDESDERLLKTVANQAAVAFENANLFQNLQRELAERKQAEANARVQLKRITALNEIDRAIGASLNMHLSLNVLLNQVTLQLGVDAASILLLNPVEQTLEYTAGTGFHTTYIRTSRVQLGQGLAGRAGLERNVLHVPNLAEAMPNNVRATLIKDENFVEYFGVPLIAKGLLKGVLEIFNRTPLAFDPHWLEYLETLGAQAAIAVDNAQLFEGMQRSNQELVTAYDATITGWSLAMDLRDKETEGHTQRVTELTLKLAKRLGINDQEQVQMRRGALLHDIGKLGIPDHILLKPGKLTDEEWQIMRRHPTYAFEMLEPIHYLRLALDIPYCHHEKWDGSGYPRGLKGEHIPLAARIFAIVDVWDALRSDRPYREGWSAQRTRDYIQAESGKHFDPQVVESFLQMLDQSPELGQ